MKSSLFQQRITLIIAGISLELLYVLYFLRLFPLVPNYLHLSALGTMTNHSSNAFWAFIFVFTMLFILFAFSWYVVRKTTDKYSLWIIGGFGLLFGVTMSFVYPITATDVYNYVAQSRVWTYYHHNPIFTPANTFLPDPIMMLTGGWGKFGSPYGPLGIMISAIPSYLAPSNLLANLLLLKLFFSLCTLATAYLVYKIVAMHNQQAAISAALFVAWNPLLLFEVSANGHNDIFMMFLALLGLLFVLKGHLKLGTVIVFASALVKFATIILIPLVIAYAMITLTSSKKRALYLFSVVLGSIALSVVAYWPFWQGIETVSRSLMENAIYLDSFSSFWGVITHQYQYRDGAMIGRTFFVTSYCFFLWSMLKKKENFLRACFWSFFFFLLFCVTNFKIWYVIWPLVLAAATPKLLERGTATLFAYLATLSAAIFSYIWIWMGQNTPKNFFFINAVSYLFTFLPPLLFFIGSMIYIKTQKRGIKEKIL